MIQGPKEAKLPRALFADENTELVALLVFGDTGSQACFKTPFLVIFCCFFEGNISFCGKDFAHLVEYLMQ